jgi:hypothetical protein
MLLPVRGERRDERALGVDFRVRTSFFNASERLMWRIAKGDKDTSGNGTGSSNASAAVQQDKLILLEPADDVAN